MEWKDKVGDYVETKDGDVGYIFEISSNDKFRCVCVKLLNGNTQIYNQLLNEEYDYDKYFRRIGINDFTKEDTKIKKISWSGDIVNGEVLYFEMSNEDLLWKLTNKVNEIIDCLNKEEK